MQALCRVLESSGRFLAALTALAQSWPYIICVWVVQDQNGAMEIELNDLKSRIDSDVMESRALEEQASAIPQLEVLYLAPSTFCRHVNGSHFSMFTQCNSVTNRA